MTEFPEGASLYVEFDTSGTRVRLRATEQHRVDLVQLAGRFVSNAPLGPTAFLVDMQDFLGGLNTLSSWPDPQGVVWEPALQQLTVSSIQDAETVGKQLAGADGDTAVFREEEVEAELGPEWRADLTAFQRRDISKLLALQHGANFSVPGAGKTRVALAVYAAMKNKGAVERLLVVSPKSAYESWMYETGACFSSPLRTVLVENARDQWAEVLVVNYERLERSRDFLASWLRQSPAMLILDEAHRMKLGARGTYGAACMALGPLAKRRLILTGTPAPNGAKDLENLLGFVWPGYGQRSVTQAVGGGDLVHASRVLNPLFTRTTKNELGLPPVEPKIRRVELSPLHGEIYQAVAGNFPSGAAAADDFAALGKSVLRLLMAATSPALLLEGGSKHEPVEYRLPPLDIPEGDDLFQHLRNVEKYEVPPKYAETARIVAENAAQGRKTLVWTTFVRSLTSLEKLLEEYHPAAVYGGTADREEELRRFREDDSCQVLISNPATLGEGISLHQVCHDAVYVDRDFMAGRYLQSMDRIHRLGLAAGTATNVTVLAARGTVDEVVEVRLQDKVNFMSQVLNDPAVQQLADLEEAPTVAGGVNAADIRAVLGHLRKL